MNNNTNKNIKKNIKKNKIFIVATNIITIMFVAFVLIFVDSSLENVISAILLLTCFLFAVGATELNFSQITLEIISVANWILIVVGIWKIWVIVLSILFHGFIMNHLFYMLLVLWVLILTPLINNNFISKKLKYFKQGRLG